MNCLKIGDKVRILALGGLNATGTLTETHGGGMFHRVDYGPGQMFFGQEYGYFDTEELALMPARQNDPPSDDWFWDGM